MTTVAVIGLGVIGTAEAAMLELTGHQVTAWDPKNGGDYPAAAIRACDYAMICVGTPRGEDGHADLEHYLDALADLPPGLPVLIRSTVPPGTTDLTAAGRDAPVACAPEFMHERPGGAWPTPADVPFLIIGGDPAARDFFRPRLAPLYPKVHECDAITAELAKYTVNLHLATRVIFINEMASIAAAFGADWEDIRQAWLMDPRITPEYTGMAGFAPGFGGRCWPKDMDAMIAAAADARYDAEFLKAVRDANRRFAS